MPYYTVGQAADLLGVSADTVRRLADRGELTMVRKPGGRRHLDGAALARYSQRVTRTTSPRTTAESARNHFPGIVTRVVKDRVAAQVEMQAGPHRLVALITREAADELGLAPGVRAVGLVKATNVIIELPGR